jgi:hypothetical protein
MQLLARPAKLLSTRYTYSAMVYLGINIAFILAELRWHLFYRLTLWDASQIRTLALLLAKALHHA